MAIKWPVNKNIVSAILRISPNVWVIIVALSVIFDVIPNIWSDFVAGSYSGGVGPLLEFVHYVVLIAASSALATAVTVIVFDKVHLIDERTGGTIVAFTRVFTMMLVVNFIYRWPAAVTVLIRSVQGGGHVLSTMLPEILLLGVLTNIILIGCLWTIAPSLALNGDLRNAIQEIFYVKLSVRMRIIFVYMLISVASFLPRAWLGAHGYSLEVGELFPWILVNVWSAALHLIWYIFVAVYYIEFTGFRNRLDDVFS